MRQTILLFDKIFDMKFRAEIEHFAERGRSAFLNDNFYRRLLADKI